MTSWAGNVKLAFRSSPAAGGLRGGALRVVVGVRPVRPANASHVGVASMTPLRASMNSMLQPTNGSMRAVPPMPNAFEASTSTL